MAMTGWYPDPGGVPGRYRYWDGRSWSEATTTDPADPPPMQGPRRPRRNHRYAPVTALGVGALVLVVVVVASVLIIRRAADADGVGAGPVSASGWDDSGPAGADSPAATPTAGPDRIRCAGGHPDELAPHSQDGRVHGGRLSMTIVDGYSAPTPEYMLSWLDDTQSVSQTTEPGWQSLFAVGEVTRGPGFTSPRQTVHTSMACAMANGWYLHPSSRTDTRDQAIDVGGHPGWILTADVRDNNPRVSVPGDQLTFVAVNDGRADTYSVWCGMVPLGDQQRIALDQQVLAGLRVAR